MTQSQSFVDFLQGIRVAAQGQIQEAVLLIGFDGGACLLNHARPIELRESLVGPPVGRKRDKELLERRWRDYMPWYRRQLLRNHTRPRDGVNERAVGCIAGLLREGVLQAVVMTDVDRALLDTLQRDGVEIFGYQWTPSLPGVSKDLRRKGFREKLLVDAADLILVNFVPGMWDQGRDAIRESRAALKHFLGTFDVIYCWGWTDFNVPLAQILPSPELRYKLYLLGGYTDGGALDEFEPTRVTLREPEDGVDDDEQATPFLLYELADKLRLAPLRNRWDPVGGLVSGAAQNGFAGSLVPGDDLTAILDGMSPERPGRHRFAVIGVDGELVRQSAMRIVSESLRAAGRQVRLHTSSNLLSLARYLTLYVGRSPNGDLVAQLSGVDTAEQAWQQPLHAQLALLVAALNQPLKEVRVILFVPTGVSEWASHAFTNETVLAAQSFFVDRYLTSGNLQRWLALRLEPCGIALDLQVGQSLADRMIRSCGEQRPEDIDWLCEAVDLWQDDVLRSMTDQWKQDDTSAGTIDVSQVPLLDLWMNIDGAYHDNHGRASLDFPVTIARRQGDVDGDGDVDGGGDGDDGGAGAPAAIPPTPTQPDSGSVGSEPWLDFDLGAVKRRTSER